MERASEARAAQAQRGSLGIPLRARGAELPLAAFAVAIVFAFQQIRVGVAGRNRPAEEGGGGPPGRRQGGNLIPNFEKLYSAPKMVRWLATDTGKVE